MQAVEPAAPKLRTLFLVEIATWVQTMATEAVLGVATAVVFVAVSVTRATLAF